MVSPEVSNPRQPPISEEALMGLMHAIDNIGKFGPMRRGLLAPQLQTLTLTDGLIKPKSVKIHDKPSHLYSGPVQLNSSGRLFRSWIRLEGSHVDPVEVNGEMVHIAAAYSQVVHRAANGEPRLLGNTITTEEGRVFRSTAKHPFESAAIGPYESTEDSYVWAEIAVLEKDTAEFRQQYPDV